MRHAASKTSFSCLFALVLAGAVVVTAQQIKTAGSIAGCLSNPGATLPGATVVAKSAGLRRSTVTDATGCYTLNDLPPGTYRVTARLLGFDNVTRDHVSVAPSTATRLDLTTAPSAMCECIRVGGSLADRWEHADAVLHVRLMDAGPAPAPPQGYYRHRAEVITALKPPAGPRSTSVEVLQNQRSGSPDPYEAGQEMVAFLKALGSNTFQIVNDDPGVSESGRDFTNVFLIHDGRVERAPSDLPGHVGKPVKAFLNELRTLSRRND